METKGLSVIIPAWGDISIVSNAVLSAARQWAPSDNAFPKYEVIIVDDWIEGRTKEGYSGYLYFMTDEFKKLYDTDRVTIQLIVNDEHKYQGESREIGYQAAKYRYFTLLDCDDTLAPNCLYRYWECIEAESKKKPIAYICGNLLSFDKNNYRRMIPGHSIWVQGRCYNRDFLNKHDVHFLTGLYSRQAEDYPWINKMDFAARHDESFQVVRSKEDADPFAYWFPNYNSLSRKDKHYGSHLSGWTLHASLSILDYMKEFCDVNGLTMRDDEEYKQQCLRMNIRAYYCLLRFMFEAATDKEWVPLEEDWRELYVNAHELKARLEEVWNEIVPSNIYEALYHEKNHSDLQFVEDWIGDFNHYVNSNDAMYSLPYSDMLDYAHSLEFDQANHCVQSLHVQAFIERHRGMKLIQM